MENNPEKILCPLCKIAYDSTMRIPKMLSNCGHTLCSMCINTELLENDNKITCPEDKFEYNNINNANYFPTNENLLQLVKSSPSQYQFILKSPNIDENIPSINGNFRQSSTFRNSFKQMPFSHTCNIHSLPMDIICIDEKKKLCAQCALQPEHTKHSIITDEEFMNQIDNLIDLFQEVDLDLKQYINKKNITAKNVLNKIDMNSKELIDIVQSISDDIIKNIEKQRDKVISFIKYRNKEIHDKYENTSFDINSLNSTTHQWMDCVKNKLQLLNVIIDPSIEFIKLIDDDPKENQTALLNAGHQIKDRYRFIQQTEMTIQKLENFCQNGLKITPIKEVIDLVKVNDDSHKQFHINTKLFSINENEKDITALRLKKFTFDYEVPQQNILKSFNYISNSSNNSTRTTTESKLINDLNTTILKKQSNKEIPKREFVSPPKNSYFFLKEDVSQLKKSKSPEKKSIHILSTQNNCEINKQKNKERTKSPNNDLAVFINGQLKNESPNFSRIDLRERGICYLCQQLKNKQNLKFKEMKFVKSNLSDDSASELIKCIITNNISVTNFNISSNGLTDKAGESIIYLLTNHHGLKMLYLTNNLLSFQMKEKIKSYSGASKSGMGNVKIFL